MKWGTQTFLLIFGISDCNFANIVVPPSDGNKNCLAHLKGQSFLKKVKTESKSTHKQRHNSCSEYIPLDRMARQTRSMTNKQKNIQTPHFRTYSWYV